MKKFRFTLQSVLRLKINIEENEKIQLYSLQAQLNALYSDMNALDALHRDGVGEQRRASQQGITIARLRELSYYLQDIDHQRMKKQSEIDQMLVRIEEQAQVLKNARTEVKTLEKLKEQQWAAYLEKTNKENEILIEDFVAGRTALTTSQGEGR